MLTGRKNNKLITSTYGEGLSNSSSPNKNTVFPPHFQTVTAPGNPHFKGIDDIDTVQTGPGDGTYASSNQQKPYVWGHRAPSGSTIEINDSTGSETVQIVHHSGAAVIIEPDGAVYVNSTSSRGGGFSCPKGDFSISAAGDIVIDGKGSISIKTAGDLHLTVGGTLNIVAGAIKTTTNTLDETVDGSASRSVTNDNSIVVGGINRTTIAGDSREQVSGNKIVDVAKGQTERIDGDHSHDVGGDHQQKIKGDYNSDVGKSHNEKIGQDRSNDVGGTSKSVVGGDSSCSTAGSATIKSGQDMSVSSQQQLSCTASTTTIGATGALTMSGQSSTLSSESTTKIVGSTTQIHGSSTTSIHAGTSVLSPDGVTSGVSSAPDNPSDPIQSPPAADQPSQPSQPKEAKTIEPNDIVDLLTSARKFPKYTGNGVIESANRAATGMISHDIEDQAEDVYNEYSKSHQGSTNPSRVGGSYDRLPEQPVNRSSSIKSEDPQISTPSPHNPNVKISRYFTLGELTNAPLSGKIPPSMWEQVVQAHILLANNVLDPLRAQFPHIIITNAWRNSKPNHITGRAVDIVVPSRSLTEHAEIARFARDNLPCDQIFLERNDRGTTHVHLRVAPVGSSVAPLVLTCNDKKCSSSTAGIDVEYIERDAKR